MKTFKTITATTITAAAVALFARPPGFVAASASTRSVVNQTQVDDKYDGTITKVEEKQLIVNVAGQDMIFSVTRDTKITLDDQTVQLDKLQGGFSVQVTTKMGGGEPPTAEMIKATTAK